MNFKSIILTLLAITLGATPAIAQQRQLPPQHNQQHDLLIANQQPIASEVKAEVSRKVAADLVERENLDEIYNTCWNSQSVNPYGNVAVPATKDIDVSKGVVPVPGRLSSRYGWRPQFGRMHRGVDLHLNVGDTVVAAFDGKVRLTKYEGGGYGYYVVIRHDNGMETVYGHLSKFLVKPDMRVKAGEPIALGGNTGRSTGPHLHFETRYLGLAVNPEGIFDFDHNTTIKDTYTFNKASYQRSQVTGPRHSASSKKSSVSASSKKAKKGASKGSKKRRRR